MYVMGLPFFASTSRENRCTLAKLDCMHDLVYFIMLCVMIVVRDCGISLLLILIRFYSPNE
jgi:hypothetical protein